MILFCSSHSSKKCLPDCNGHEGVFANGFMSSHLKDGLRCSTTQPSCWSSFHKVQVKKIFSSVLITGFEENANILRLLSQKKKVINIWSGKPPTAQRELNEKHFWLKLKLSTAYWRCVLFSECSMILFSLYRSALCSNECQNPNYSLSLRPTTLPLVLAIGWVPQSLCLCG